MPFPVAGREGVQNSYSGIIERIISTRVSENSMATIYHVPLRILIMTVSPTSARFSLGRYIKAMLHGTIFNNNSQCKWD